MTHEFKDILYQAKVNQQNGIKSVLATVVFLEGSSYRKPGVRMLISENGNMVGAVSGGCVENEIKRSAQSVFQNDIAKVMTYDGRYRLGCEGVLYILIEPFTVSDVFLKSFQTVLETRQHFKITSYFKKENESNALFGSIIQFDDNLSFTFFEAFKPEEKEGVKLFTQVLKPSLKLLIIGGEHDAVKLCTMASLLGWDVNVITSIKDPKLLSDFPGAKSVEANTPELADLKIDNETVVVLMTHNYVQDLKYILKLVSSQPKYIGILGSTKRREQLQNDVWHYKNDVPDQFFVSIYSPAGLNIGAITPEEIALSILSEILTVVREREPISLRNMSGRINK